MAFIICFCFVTYLFDCIGSVNSEFGEMDSSDEKLQKLLDSSTATNSDGSDEDAANSATVGSFINALLNQVLVSSLHNHIQI